MCLRGPLPVLFAHHEDPGFSGNTICVSRLRLSVPSGHRRFSLNSVLCFPLADGGWGWDGFLPSARTQGCAGLRLRGTDLCVSEVRVASARPDTLPERPRCFVHRRWGSMVPRTVKVVVCTCVCVCVCVCVCECEFNQLGIISLEGERCDSGSKGSGDCGQELARY